MNNKSTEFSYVFPKTIPVMVGYLFLGMAWGILMKVNGFGLIWSAVISIIVFGGSLQYLGITMLGSLVNPLTALFMSLMLSARHLFYGISMLSRYRKTSKVIRPYLIFGLTDETFSVLCQAEIPEHLDKDKVYFLTTVLDQSYWVIGSIVGSVLGSVISFDTTGLDFALTALFVTIFTDQWRQKNGHMPAMLGVLASVGCIMIFGQSNFIVPAMIVIFAVLGIRYKKTGGRNEEEGKQ